MTMGRVASEIGRVYPMLLRPQLRAMTKKIRKSAPLPTQPPKTPPTSDRGPCLPPFHCCSSKPCNPLQQNLNPMELCAEMSPYSHAPLTYTPNYPSCCPVCPQGCPPLCCPPQSHSLACMPARSAGCLGRCPLDAYSSCGAGCYCSYCQQPCCPQQPSQPCCSSGNLSFGRPQTRVVCCCCPAGGSPPFNMTGPPPCCRTPNFPPPTYGASACYGTPAGYGAQPCYGAIPCYGDLGNQFNSCSIPWSQSNLNTAGEFPQEAGKIQLPQEHIEKKVVQKQEVK